MLGHGNGPPQAKIMLVGEAWGNWEEQRQEPFVGPSGEEMNRMLHEAGILRSECFVTNLVNARPPNASLESWIPTKKKDIKPDYVPVRGRLVAPIIRQGLDALLREISLVRPNIIVAFGGTALWALTGAMGILKWRGSQLRLTGLEEYWPDGPMPAIKLIPTIHPAAILREWSHRQTVIFDLKRAAAERYTADYTNVPKWNFIIKPSYDAAANKLHWILAGLDSGELEWIDFDLETRASHIDCAGLSWSRTDAICIPFMASGMPQGYWLQEEEAALVYLLYRILTHPRAKVRGQNLLYDCQYTYRHWHFVPRVAQDTMIAWHSHFCGLRKSLDYQASLLCDYYVQWKPDKTAWKVGG